MALAVGSFQTEDTPTETELRLLSLSASSW